MIPQTKISGHAQRTRDEEFFRTAMAAAWDREKQGGMPLDYLTWREGFTNGWFAGRKYQREL